MYSGPCESGWGWRNEGIHRRQAIRDDGGDRKSGATSGLHWPGERDVVEMLMHLREDQGISETVSDWRRGQKLRVHQEASANASGQSCKIVKNTRANQGRQGESWTGAGGAAPREGDQLPHGRSKNRDERRRPEDAGQHQQKMQMCGVRKAIRPTQH